MKLQNDCRPSTHTHAHTLTSHSTYFSRASHAHWEGRHFYPNVQAYKLRLSYGGANGKLPHHWESDGASAW